jgi:hypothetical protein
VIQKRKRVVYLINEKINKRINVTISHKMYNKIQVLAKSEMRSANSLLIYLANLGLQQPEWREKVQALIDNGELEE